MLIKKSGNKIYTDRDFGVSGPRDHQDEPPHTHDFAEFVYVFHGRCVHTVDGRDYPAQKGDLLFINYNSVHSVHAVGTVNYADVLLKVEFIDESLRGRENAFSLLQLRDFRDFHGMIHPDNCFVHFNTEEQKQVEMLILSAGKEAQSDAAGSHLIVSACLNMFLTLVFRKMALPMQAALGINEALLDHLKSHCGDPLPMTQTARMCGYSDAYFSRLFRKLTGMTYTDYLTDCRLEKACGLLTETDHSVDEVIRRCGFTDRTKFFKRFNEKTGTTPMKYRKMSKSNTNIR